MFNGIVMAAYQIMQIRFGFGLVVYELMKLLSSMTTTEVTLVPIILAGTW